MRDDPIVDVEITADGVPVTLTVWAPVPEGAAWRADAEIAGPSSLVRLAAEATDPLGAVLRACTLCEQQLPEAARTDAWRALRDPVVAWLDDRAGRKRVFPLDREGDLFRELLEEALQSGLSPDEVEDEDWEAVYGRIRDALGARVRRLVGGPTVERVVDALILAFYFWEERRSWGAHA